MANLQKNELIVIIFTIAAIAPIAVTYLVFLNPGEARSQEQTAIDIALNSQYSKKAADQYGQF